MATVKVGTVALGGPELFVISGPCVIESLDLCMEIAAFMKVTCEKLGLGYVFKASFDKANRTSISSFRGPGIEKGLGILAEVKASAGVPVLTDVHEPSQAAAAAEVVDALQVPAFLARQTDLVVSAAETGLPVNLKKAQFMAPWDMKAVIEKAEASGNKALVLTERGSSFGYNRLVVDMTAIPAMKSFGYPVVIDGTHAVQQPGGLGSVTGGDRSMVPAVCRAAVAAGADGVFLEVHPDPDKAKSDAANSLALSDAPALLAALKRIKAAAGP